MVLYGDYRKSNTRMGQQKRGQLKSHPGTSYISCAQMYEKATFYNQHPLRDNCDLPGQKYLKFKPTTKKPKVHK